MFTSSDGDEENDSFSKYLYMNFGILHIYDIDHLMKSVRNQVVFGNGLNINGVNIDNNLLLEYDGFNEFILPKESIATKNNFILIILN